MVTRAEIIKHLTRKQGSAATKKVLDIDTAERSIRSKTAKGRRYNKRTGKRVNKKKVKTYKVDSPRGQIWRTQIDKNGMTTLVDIPVKGQKYRYKVPISGMYSPGMKKKVTELIAKGELPVYLGEEYAYTDPQVRDPVIKDIYTSRGGGGRRSKTFYDYGQAKAYAKGEYESALADWQSQWGAFGKPLKARWQRRGAPRALGQRGQQKRLIRGAGRMGGLAGKKHREAKTMKRTFKAWKSGERQRLQRYKEDIESYRDTWGL